MSAKGLSARTLKAVDNIALNNQRVWDRLLEELAKQRYNLGLTNADIAKGLEVPLSSVERFFSNDTSISVRDTLMYALYLGVNLHLQTTTGVGCTYGAECKEEIEKRTYDSNYLLEL